MKFTKTDMKTLLIVIVAIIIAGTMLYYGDDVPVLEQAHEGFGG